jgi:hypothetical protein
MIRFPEFRDFLAAHPFSPQDQALPEDLELYRDGQISMYYAPFDYRNPHARVALCGITPGRQQALLALAEAHRQLNEGAPDETVLLRAKLAASFGGPTRRNLVALLDHIGLPGLLGIETSAELFSSQADLVHFTSVLRYPVFVRGANYSGVPDMLAHPRLLQQIEDHLAPEVQALRPGVIFIPMGPKPARGLHYLVQRGLLDRDQVWEGLPHPSGANAERIAFFLGNKPAERLSLQTNAAAILAKKEKLLEKVRAYRF